MKRPRIVAWDTETHRIQPGLLAPPIVCHSFSDPEYCPAEPEYLLRHQQDHGDTIESYLTQDDCVIAGANIAYDFGCLMVARPELIPAVFDAYDADRIWDVEHALLLDLIARGYVHDGGIIDPTTGFALRGQNGKVTNRCSLWNCTRLCLGRTDAKDNNEWVLRYHELENLPIADWPEKARVYPLDDARNTREVADWQRDNCLNTHDLPAQCRAALALHLGSIWGIRTDGTAVAALAKKTTEQQELLKAKFAEWGFYKKDKKGWHQVKKPIREMVVNAYEGDPPLTDKGGISTDRVTLEESGDEKLMELAGMSKVDKIATYLESLEEAARLPLNVRPNVLLATGRSSYEGVIQLLPRKGGVRDCFVARRGFVFSSCDYAAIEMSTLAQVCIWTVGYSHLADAINSGKDPHCIFGAALMGISYEEFVARLKAGDKYVKDLRQAGKAANFGFPGMMGPAKLVIAKRREGLRICQIMHRCEKCGVVKIREWNGFEYPPLCKECVEGADELKHVYLDQLWLEMRPYFRWVTAHLDSNENTIEQFVSRRLRGNLEAPAAANTLFQGLAADGFKRAAWRISREAHCDRSSPLWGSHLVIGLHDESFLEIPEEKAHEAAHRQADIMVEEMKKLVPDVAVSVTPAIMRRWYKDAEAVYDTSGRLIPWEPKSEKPAGSVAAP